MGEHVTDGGHRAAALDEARLELDRAADDIERLLRRLDERTERVEWLESLLDELLGLLTVPVVVIDDAQCIVAASHKAEEQVPGLAGALGRPASSVLPGRKADDLDVVAILPGGARLVVLPT